MSELIGILGDSGKGKTTSLRNLDPDETVIVNVSGKPLPFKGWKGDYTKGIKDGGNYVVTNNVEKIKSILKYIHAEREDIKTVVIDDMQYLQAFEYFKRRDEKGFQRFNDIGGDLFETLNVARNLRDDLRVVTTFHPDEEGEGLDKKKVFKTIGKMVREKLTPEGLYTVIFWADYDPQDDEYYFATETDGSTPARAPMGMFDEKRIPNDLDAALDKIDEYYYGE